MGSIAIICRMSSCKAQSEDAGSFWSSGSEQAKLGFALGRRSRRLHIFFVFRVSEFAKL